MSAAEASDASRAPLDVEKPLAVVSIEVEGQEILDLELPTEMAAANKTYQAALNALVVKHKGYRCVLKGAKALAVFAEAAAAVAFAVELQTAAFSASWGSAEMDAFYQETEEKTEPAAYGKLWNGLRLKVGVHYGKAGAIAKRKDSEFYSYSGDAIVTAQRVQEVACGGQVLATAAAIEAAGDAAKGEGVAATALGPHTIPWLSEKIDLTQLLPAALAARAFPKSYLKAEEQQHAAAAAAATQEGAKEVASPTSDSEGSSPGRKVEELRKKVEAARAEGGEERTIEWYEARHAADAAEIAKLKARIAELEAASAAAEKPAAAAAEAGDAAPKK